MSFLDTVPWFLPGLLVSIAVGLGVNRIIAGALAMSRRMAAAAVVSVGGIIAATLTPLRDAIESGMTGSGSCDLSRMGLASANELAAASVNDAFLNVVLFVPLGLTIGLAPGSRSRSILVLAGALLPIAIEGTQMLVPALARACESADVFDNLSGLALGLVAGSLLARVRS